MRDPDELERLTNAFRELGASDPEGWARSQVQEGIPQLARFPFLRQAWRGVVSGDDPTWIDRMINHAQPSPDGPYAGAGHALNAQSLRLKPSRRGRQYPASSIRLIHFTELHELVEHTMNGLVEA